MKIFIGSDHAGFKLKEQIKRFLSSKNIAYEDLGNKVLDQADDYPDFSLAVAQAVAKHKNSAGIVICGSAGGACIAANKVKGIRAVAVRNIGEAKLAKEDDHANIICLAGGGQVQKKVRNIGLAKALAEKIVTTWLASSSSQALRHQRRVGKIKKIEQKNFK